MPQACFVLTNCCLDPTTALALSFWPYQLVTHLQLQFVNPILQSGAYLNHAIMAAQLLDHHQAQVSLYFLCGFALPCATYMFILMILYDFCLLHAQFCYKIVCICNVESHMHLGKFPMVRRTLFCKHCNLKRDLGTKNAEQVENYQVFSLIHDESRRIKDNAQLSVLFY
jgi:hypothetical protein